MSYDFQGMANALRKIMRPMPDKEIICQVTRREYVFTASTLPMALRKAADWIEHAITFESLARFTPLVDSIEVRTAIDPDDGTRFVFSAVVCLRDEFS